MTKEIVKLAAARIVKNEMQKRALVDRHHPYPFVCVYLKFSSRLTGIKL